MADDKKVVSIELNSISGKHILFGGDTEWKLYKEIEGLGELSPDFDKLLKTTGYGSQLSAASLPSREVSFKVVYTGNKKAEMREQLSNALAPGFEKYTVTIKYMGKKRELHDCYISKCKIPAENIHSFIKAEVTMLALDPLFWSDTESSFSNGSVNRGTAPALPIITITGASAGSEVSFGKYTIMTTGNGAATCDFENLEFTNLDILSFSTDARRIMVEPGELSISTSGCSVSGSFKERYYLL